MAKWSRAEARAAGQRGGRTTAERHGRVHMQRIGLCGWWTTVLRHWDGNPRAYANYMIAMGLAATDPVPDNGAFDHHPGRLRYRALLGVGDRLPRSWKPPALPDGFEPPF